MTKRTTIPSTPFLPAKSKSAQGNTDTTTKSKVGRTVLPTSGFGTSHSNVKNKAANGKVGPTELKAQDPGKGLNRARTPESLQSARKDTTSERLTRY